MANSQKKLALKKTLALWALSSGALIVVLDTTIVAVALPSIMADLRASESSLTWLVNAYTLPFAGFLILSGRLGDLYGPRRTFLSGLLLFVLGSLVCGTAPLQTMLLVGRALQGLAGAVVMAVCLVLLMNIFRDTAERARAISVYGLVCSAGGAVGELLGGVLTKELNWHWIFLVNVPVGIAVGLLCLRAVPADPPRQAAPRLDLSGAVTITTAITALVYTLTPQQSAALIFAPNLGSLSIAAVSLGLFLLAERHARDPLVPFQLFKRRNFTAANLLGVLWAVGSSAWLVFLALYLQRVLGYDPLRVGIAFLPAQGIMAWVSVAGAARIVARFGVREPLLLGLLLVATGLLLFSRAPLHGSYLVDVLPGTLLLGFGGGIASTPLLLAAMHEVDHAHTGVASGVVNTAFMIGSALGLVLLATLANLRTSNLQAAGVPSVTALDEGYHLVFLVAACFATGSAVLAALTLRSGPLPLATVAASLPLRAKVERV